MIEGNNSREPLRTEIKKNLELNKLFSKNRTTLIERTSCGKKSIGFNYLFLSFSKAKSKEKPLLPLLFLKIFKNFKNVYPDLVTLCYKP